jgi:hypothetical protein
MRARVPLVAVGIALMLTITACSSSSKSSNGKSSNSSSPSGLHVQTPNGQVSLSLNGQLPPNWPSSFPVPKNSNVAGSGSLVNGSSGGSVGVYTTSESASDAFNFYKTNSSLTVTSSSSAGGSSAFLGSVKLGGTYNGGSVTVAALSGKTYIVIVLPASATNGSVTSTT